jgi:hypothetical protein
MIVKGGSTDVTTYFQMRLLTGGDATGLTISDFDMQYVRTRETAAAKADAVALAAANTAHTDNRGIEVDATDTPGLYRFDWPDAAFAAGTEVVLTIKHTSCFTESLRVELVDYNPRDGVRLGLTALPNAAAEAAGGLYTRGTGAGQINQAANGQIDANVTHAAGTAWLSGCITSATFTNGAIGSNAIASNAIGAAELAADAVTEIAAGVWAEATRTLTAIDEDSTTLDIDAAVRAAVGLAAADLDTQLSTIDNFLDTEVAAIKAKTDSLTFTVAGQVDANIESVNAVTVNGTGAAGNEWGP